MWKALNLTILICIITTQLRIGIFCGPGFEAPYSIHVAKQWTVNTLEEILILLENTDSV